MPKATYSTTFFRFVSGKANKYVRRAETDPLGIEGL